MTGSPGHERRARTGRLLGSRPLLAFVLAAVGLMVWYGLRSDVLIQTTIVAAALLILVMSVRWPLLPLFVFAALIPFDQVLVIGPLGTVSRLAGIVFMVAYGIPRLGRLTLRAMPLWGWAFIGWAIASFVWALDQSVALSELPTLLQLFVMAVLVADVVVHRPGVVRPILWTYSISAAATALIGIVVLVSGGTAIADRLAAFRNQDQAQFAAFLLPALVFSVYELLRGRIVAVSSAAAAVIASATAAGVVLSGTRGAWASFAVVGVVFIGPQLRSPRRIAAAALIGLMLLGTLGLPGVATFVDQRIAEAVPTGGAGRVDIWSVGASIWESSPIVGVGFANFPVAFTPELIRATDVTANPGPGRAPHDIVVGTLGELGIVGLFLLVLFVGPLVLRRGWGPEAAVVQASVAALLVDALFLDVLSNQKQVWLLLGLAAGLSYLARPRNRSMAAAPALECRPLIRTSALLPASGATLAPDRSREPSLTSVSDP